MSSIQQFEEVERILSDAGVEVHRVDERSFPGEKWLIILVSEDTIAVAQSLAGTIERSLNEGKGDESSYAVTFRPRVLTGDDQTGKKDGGRLAGRDVTQLINLLEARSRTSDALPSLKYVEDPRASLPAVAASRHQLVYGRRGVGKTSLLLEAKRLAEREGHVTVWINTHVLRKLSGSEAFEFVAEAALSSVLQHAGTSEAAAFSRLDQELTNLRHARQAGQPGRSVSIAEVNKAFRAVLRQEIVRLYIFLDDFYLMPIALQSHLLDDLAGMLRDCDGWLKVASIERLTRPFELSSKIGLEVPHDASQIDLDVTLEDPASAQKFLESVLANYTSAAGIKQPSSIAKPEALGRLVLASGGVPRDYLNLFASSIVAARQSRPQAQEIGREDVAKAAGTSARSKKRDLEQDVSSENSRTLLQALEKLSESVKALGYTYFRVDMNEKNEVGYEVLGQLVDMRFVHLIQAGFSDQHRAGTRYEAYLLDLSEYTDVRLKRSLQVLDLEGGKWTKRLSGKAGTAQRLPATQLRDVLRQSPLIKMEDLL